MDKILDHLMYTIKHPKTGKTVDWKGERIRKYQNTYGADVVLPAKKSEKKTSSTVTEKETKDVN